MLAEARQATPEGAPGRRRLDGRTAAGAADAEPELTAGLLLLLPVGNVQECAIVSGRAKLSTRIAARLAGEVSAETAEAYRQAGAGVYDLLLECEQRRSQGSEGPDGSWLSDASAGTLFLCNVVCVCAADARRLVR